MSDGATRVYGQSDDNIYFKGEFRGRISWAGIRRRPNDDEPGTLVVMSDGTLLEIRYGDERHRGIWKIRALKLGHLFLRIDPCTEEDADLYSDVAHFLPGIRWAYTADDWRAVD